MKLMRCPVNGLRPIQEFAYGGLFRPSPDPDRSTDREWADYVFSRSGEPALKKEWWYHIASGTWFIAERDTRTDEIVETYLFDGA
ncbi:MAG: sarcosine oxidase subunit delta [Acidimicrobiia bacterium]|nr:sarcosine oxidase subunit delta [Acidimicrobiia bacterium]